MNKSEFVAAVAAKTNLSQAEASRVVDAVLGTVTETLAKGDDIRFTGCQAASNIRPPSASKSRPLVSSGVEYQAAIGVQK